MLEEKDEKEGKKADVSSMPSKEDFEKLQQQVLELTSRLQSPTHGGPAGQTAESVATVKTLEKLVDRLSKIGGGDVSDTGQYVFTNSYDESELDPDDTMPKEKWVTLFSHKIGYVIPDDMRSGKSVKAPFGLIVFKYLSTKRIRHGKETDIMNLSSYVCRSKKELEWLMKHRLYGVTFFKNLNTALTSDAERASRLASHVVKLQQVSQHQLVSMARSHGIDVGRDTDINELRAMIAHRTVEKEMEKVKGNTSKILLEQEMEAAVIGTVVK